jgi:hypothetical protein
VGVELFRTDGPTDMTNLIMVFRNFSDASEKKFVSSILRLARSQRFGKEGGSTDKSMKT